MSSKKLLEQCQKLEKLWNHVFTATITLANITQENQWYNKLTDMIDKQQTAPIWMSDAKVWKFYVKWNCNMNWFHEISEKLI